MDQRAITETLKALDAIKAAQKEKNRSYQRDYYASHREKLKLDAMRRSYERYSQMLDEQHSSGNASVRPN